MKTTYGMTSTTCLVRVLVLTGLSAAIQPAAAQSGDSLATPPAAEIKREIIIEVEQREGPQSTLQPAETGWQLSPKGNRLPSDESLQPTTLELSQVYDGLPRNPIAVEVHDLRERMDEVDRLLESATIKRILNLTTENIELRAEMRVQQAQHELQLQMMELKLDHSLALAKVTAGQVREVRPNNESARRGTFREAGERSDIEGLRKELELRNREYQKIEVALEHQQQANMKSQQHIKQVTEKLNDVMRNAERAQAEAVKRAEAMEVRAQELQQRLEQMKASTAAQEPNVNRDREVENVRKKDSPR